MSDNLHARIAAVLGDELFKRDAYTEYGTDDEPGQWRRVDGHINLTALADAVIRELDLEKQAHYDPDCPFYRYVTDWIAPDE